LKPFKQKKAAANNFIVVDVWWPYRPGVYAFSALEKAIEAADQLAKCCFNRGIDRYIQVVEVSPDARAAGKVVYTTPADYLAESPPFLRVG
jgi:hypothetical protein